MAFLSLLVVKSNLVADSRSDLTGVHAMLPLPIAVMMAAIVKSLRPHVQYNEHLCFW